MPPEPLGRDEIHLWYVFTAHAGAGRLRACEELLSEEEQAERQRFLVERPRQQHLLARALVRTTLSRYADVSPREWRFARSRFGKPAVAAPAGVPLRFNVSHSHGVVACAVSREWEIGVDVEDAGRDLDWLGLARWFAAEEQTRLRELPAADRRLAFFELWTLKEAYVKARGEGMSMPLSTFAFRTGPGGVEFAPPPDDDPAAWHFEQFWIGPRHRGALAVRRPPGQAVRLLLREADLLGDCSRGLLS
ncbi:MAG TPA: 4'-phosphopantetheinyl transferase superfamily protein [Gemmataceae bacterium]|nr:4'-phosphopantetheinyl transferase superfamily protein [Gemmataceae bacterium]